MNIPVEFEDLKEDLNTPTSYRYSNGGMDLFFQLGFRFNNQNNYAFYNQTAPGKVDLLSFIKKYCILSCNYCNTAFL